MRKFILSDAGDRPTTFLGWGPNMTRDEMDDLCKRIGNAGPNSNRLDPLSGISLSPEAERPPGPQTHVADAIAATNRAGRDAGAETLRVDKPREQAGG